MNRGLLPIQEGPVLLSNGCVDTSRPYSVWWPLAKISAYCCLIASRDVCLLGCSGQKEQLQVSPQLHPFTDCGSVAVGKAVELVSSTFISSSCFLIFFE